MRKGPTIDVGSGVGNPGSGGDCDDDLVELPECIAKITFRVTK
jgi:hypothetical protein